MKPTFGETLQKASASKPKPPKKPKDLLKAALMKPMMMKDADKDGM